MRSVDKDKREAKESQTPKFDWPKLSTPIEGLIQLWVDICCIRGKASLAGQLKPYLARALAEPGSSVYRLVEAAPAQKDFLAGYACQPTHLRLRLISEVLSEEVFCQALDIFQNGMSCLAMMNKAIGITFAEAERRIGQSFQHELCRVRLEELLGRLGQPPSEVDIHTLLCNLGLTPGSVAGADKRLRSILAQRIKTLSGETPYFEQDVKIALWDCSQSKYLSDELGKVLKRQGEPIKQIWMLLRMAQGEEQQLLRTTLLRVLRKTIQELPDIHEEVRKAKQGGREFPLTKEVLATLQTQQSEDTQDDIWDLLTRRGVDIEHLDSRDLDLLAQELDRMMLGRTRKEYYGQNKNKMEQRFKHLCSKLNTQTQ